MQWCEENNVSYRTILRARKGTNVPNVGSLLQISTALGCSLQTLLDLFPAHKRKAKARKG
jgi:hypothetical protein